MKRWLSRWGGVALFAAAASSGMLLPGISLALFVTVFGIADRTDRRIGAGAKPDSSLLTMDGDQVGTPAYMAPEQLKKQLEYVLPARITVWNLM